MAGATALTLSFDPPGPQFAISDQAVMPTIAVTAVLPPGAAPAGSAPPQFRWTVTLKSTGLGCAHSLNKVTSHPDIVQTTATPTLTIPFTQVRGGTLTVAVQVQVGTRVLTAARADLSIVGTNPTVAGLTAATTGAPDMFKKLMRLESQLRQFRAAACPLFSGDNLGGVGLCQLTPPSSVDQIWDWKANVRGGLALYREKERIARAYPGKVRAGAEFRRQVAAYNAALAAAPPAAAPADSARATPPADSTRRAAPAAAARAQPVTVTVPDFTADQLALDTIRGFNGYAAGLHEYRLKLDDNGLLVVTLDASGRSGSAEWERISAADRTAAYVARGIAANRRGDPDYVDDVLRQASF